MARLFAVCLLLASCVVPTLAQGNQASPGPGASAPNYGYWWAYGAMTLVLGIFLIATLIGLHHWSLELPDFPLKVAPSRNPLYDALLRLTTCGLEVTNVSNSLRRIGICL